MRPEGGSRRKFSLGEPRVLKVSKTVEVKDALQDIGSEDELRLGLALGTALKCPFR